MTSRRGFSSKKAARDARRRLVERQERGEIRRTRQTFGAYWERWLGGRRAYLEPGTWQAYKRDERLRLRRSWARHSWGASGSCRCARASRQATAARPLRAGGELSDALAAYAAERRRRAHMLQRESSRFARMALSTHTIPRDLMARLTPEPIRRHMLERLMRRHAPRRQSTAG
jgi:hypothetical protein